MMYYNEPIIWLLFLNVLGTPVIIVSLATQFYHAQPDDNAWYSWWELQVGTKEIDWVLVNMANVLCNR